MPCLSCPAIPPPSAGQWPLLANLALTSSSAFFGGGGLWTAAFHPSFLALLVLAVELGGLGRQLLGFSNIGRLRCEFPPLSTIAHLIEAPCRESLSANDIPLPFPLFLTWREGGRRRRLVALSYVLVVAVKTKGDKHASSTWKCYLFDLEADYNIEYADKLRDQDSVCIIQVSPHVR